MKPAHLKTMVKISVLAGLLFTTGLHATEPLRICAATDNLPLSDDAPARGMEIELGWILAQRMGRKLELVWRNPGGGAADRALLSDDCDAVLGAVASGDAFTRAQPIPGITLTRPYYSAGYVIVRRAQSPSVERLAELGDERIAVEMISIPIYTLKQRGHRVFAVDDHAAVIEAVSDGRANYGYVWGPVAAWDLRGREDVVIDARFKPDERWDFAVAVRADAPKFKHEIDSVLTELEGSGVLANLFSRNRLE